jgi:hypothetical protein
MLRLFKRRRWVEEIVPVASGTCDKLAVTLRNIPCLTDGATGDRKYRYGDFGHQFLNELHNQLEDFEDLRTKLGAGSGANAIVDLPSMPAVTVELRGIVNASKGQFYSDIADALLDAFKSIRLRP